MDDGTATPPPPSPVAAEKVVKPLVPRRKWARRITYLLVAGGLLVGGGAWLLRQPMTSDFLIRKIDLAFREETGLEFEARNLEIGLYTGTFAINDLRYGGDLLRIRRVEVQADLWSLTGEHPRIYRLSIQGPELRVDTQRLAALKLKPPSKKPLPQIKLDRLEVKDGTLDIREPKWNLPQAHAGFSATGKGLGPNLVRIELKTTDLAAKTPGGTAKGHAEITADLSESILRLLKAEIDFGGQKLEASGTFEPKSRQLSAKIKALLDVAPALNLAQNPSPHTRPATSVTGQLAVDVNVAGSLQKPAWDLHLHSNNLAPGTLGFTPGSLDFNANGTLKEARLRTLTWHSDDGDLALQGEWKKGLHTKTTFQAARVDLNPLAAFSRVGQARDLQAFFDGEAELPGDPFGKGLRLDLVKARTTGHIQRLGAKVGDFSASLDRGRFNLNPLNLHLEDLELSGQASGQVGAKGLETIKAEGHMDTDAARVAVALKAWDVVELDMAGRVQADVALSYRPPEGLHLTGDLKIQDPRWHGGQADRLDAQVQILGSELSVKDIVVQKGQGRGYGDLWLTWAKRPGASSQFEACFSAFRLPISEGLKAADAGDLPIEGTASGWARLWGPFAALEMRGAGFVENGSAYQVQVPALSADFYMDLAEHRIGIPELRIAESPAALALGDPKPTGALGLLGRMELDLKRRSWWGNVSGSLDTSLLALPGPRVLTDFEAKVEGPWANTFGPRSLPNGEVKFSHARVFAGDQSIENLEGALTIDRGEVQAWLGQGGASGHILDVAAWSQGGQLRAGGHVKLDAATADTPRLAARITRNLMEDLRLDSDFSATWEPEGFHWQGHVNQLLARFSGFDLTQAQPAFVHGNLEAAQVDLPLEAQERSTGRSGTPSSTGFLSLSGLVPFTTTGPLSLQAKGSADLGHLKTILDSLMEVDPYSLLADLQPSGTSKVDLQIQGTPADPQLDGVLKLEGGHVQIRTYPQSGENITATVVFHGREISILESEPLRGQLAQGSLTAWGSLVWQFGGLARYDFKARLEDFQMRDVPQGFEVAGSLDARLSGNDEDGGWLHGAVLAERMAYHADINLSDILLNLNTGTAALSSFDPDDPLARIKLDLDLKLNQPWRFDTNLLKLEGIPLGSFKVLGTLAHPGLKGKMELIPGGSLTNLLPAGDVTVERGSIDFSDPSQLNPFINVQGRIDVPPYLVTMSITGRVDQLNVVPSSTPSLRQDEIVAILVDPAAAPTIGSSVGSNAQTALNYGIASAGSGLLGTLALANFQEQLRRVFSLDRLSVSPRTGATGTPEVSITAGKSFNFLGRRTPLLVTYHRAGSLVTWTGKAEWRFGNYVLQFGVSDANATEVNLTGEIRHTWSPN